jgi:hypothetical protein
MRRSHAQSFGLLAIVLALACVAAGPAVASDPPSQAVTVPTTPGQTVTVTWTGTVLPGANPSSECGQPTDVGQDSHEVQLSVPPGTYDSVTVLASATVSYDGPNDLIVTVVGPDGSSTSADGGFLDEDETATFTDPAAGTYTILACMFAGATPQPYTGTLTLEAAERPVSAIPPGCPGGTGPASPRVKHPKGVLRDVQAGIDCLAPITAEQQADTAVEPSISVNPSDPRNAVALYQEGRVDAGCAEATGFATTTDAGRTWTFGELPHLTTATGGEIPLASDPVVAFGPNNILYANTLLCLEDSNDLAISVSRDGGLTWGDPIRLHVNDTLPMTDKNWMVVDNSNAPGHHLGRIYLVWDNIAPVVAAYSDDQGQTWQGPFVIYSGQGIGTIPLVMPDGDLAVVFSTLADALPPIHRNPGDYEDEVLDEIDKQVIVVLQGAGTVPTGAPLVASPPVTVAADAGQDVRRQRAGEGLPTAAVDPETGRIYVAWTDARFRTDEANDILVTSSADEGLTWSGATRVNPGPPDDFVDRFTPAIAVEPDGDVVIAYRVQYEAPAVADFSPFVDTFLQRSSDGGETFSAPLRVNSVRTDVRFAAFSRASAFLGDYSQVSSAGRFTYIVRTEAFRLSLDEPATFPPAVHHQRTWVAVVSS